MKTPEQRMLDLFKWGDKNTISILLNRFGQTHSKTNKVTRYYEIKFIERKNNHRTSIGKAETLDEAMNLVWKHYKAERPEKVLA